MVILLDVKARRKKAPKRNDCLSIRQLVKEEVAKLPQTTSNRGGYNLPADKYEFCTTADGSRVLGQPDGKGWFLVDWAHTREQTRESQVYDYNWALWARKKVAR